MIPPPPPAEDRRPAPPKAWQPRAEWERRRLDEARRRARYQRLGYWGYLSLVLKEDQVFGVLLGLMVLQCAAFALVAARAEFRTLPAASAALYALMLAGLVTFQPWARSILLWVAGVGLLMSAVRVFQMLLAPLMVASSAQLAWVWLSTILQVASLLFLIVVLSERNAYFRGLGERAEPKRARLADYLRRDSWRRAVSPAERSAEEESAATRATRPPQHPQPPSHTPPGEEREERKDLETALCRWCGKEVPERAETCPQCGRTTVEAGEPRPLGGPRPGPVTPRAKPSSRLLPSLRQQGELYRVRPMEPAPGQAGVDLRLIRRMLSWGNVRAIARDDPLFGALLVALALQALVAIMGLNIAAILGALALIWGVLTLQRWGYWLALGLAGLQFLSNLGLLCAGLVRVSEPDPLGLAYLSGLTALNAFIGLALLMRSYRFS